MKDKKGIVCPTVASLRKKDNGTVSRVFHRIFLYVHTIDTKKFHSGI